MCDNRIAILTNIITKTGSAFNYGNNGGVQLYFVSVTNANDFCLPQNKTINAPTLNTYKTRCYNWAVANKPSSPNSLQIANYDLILKSDFTLCTGCSQTYMYWDLKVKYATFICGPNPT